MVTLLPSLFAFLTVVLVVYLAYVVLSSFFDRGNKEKNRRLHAIRASIRSGGEGGGTEAASSAPEAWLRNHFGPYVQLEALVRRAHSPLTAWRWLGIMCALFAGAVLLGLMRHLDPLPLTLLALAASAAPLLWLLHEAAQRRKAFNDKFPETLDHISRALRAGHSLPSAIGAVGREIPGAAGEEFKTVFDEINFGIPFKDAVARLADRVPDDDLKFFAVSIMIQHETGGNLTELLDGLAKTIRKRIKLRGKVRTLTSEGRISAWVLGILPFALGGIFRVISPEYISLLWTTPQGSNLLLTGAGLMVAGFFVLSRIVRLKV